MEVNKWIMSFGSWQELLHPKPHLGHDFAWKSEQTVALDSEPPPPSTLQSILFLFLKIFTKKLDWHLLMEGWMNACRIKIYDPASKAMHPAFVKPFHQKTDYCKRKKCADHIHAYTCMQGSVTSHQTFVCPDSISVNASHGVRELLNIILSHDFLKRREANIIHCGEWKTCLCAS